MKGGKDKLGIGGSRGDWNILRQVIGPGERFAAVWTDVGTLLGMGSDVPRRRGEVSGYWFENILPMRGD